MRFSPLALALGACLTLMCAASNGAEDPRTTSATSPRIGLALSGGGARGMAHVGVLKVLEEQHIPVDCIAGTSMGSIIGGLYAAGYSADELEKALLAMDWDDVFNDAPPRPDRSFRRKRDDDNYLIKAKPGYKDGKVRIPLAAIQGQKFDIELARLTLRAAEIDDFDRLPIPFRAVAADIETGEAVVIDDGSLAQAVRASMAVPGAFAPVEYKGRLLVDGGIANNIPIDVVRDLCADVVIAIDISTPLNKRDHLTSALSIVGQLTGILTRRNAEAQIATLKPGHDIFMVPKLGDLTSADFNRGADAIRIGEAAAREQLAALSRLARAPQATSVAHGAAGEGQPPIVSFIRLDNRSRLDDAVIRQRIEQPVGAPLDIGRMESGIQQVYGLDVFESVRYEVVEENGQTGVVVHAREKDWGPNYLQLGLSFSDNLEGDNAFNLGVAVLRNPINALGGEVRFAGSIGENPDASAEIHQPLDPLSRYFVASKLYWERDTLSLDNGGGGSDAGRYRLSQKGAILSTGRELGVWGEFRVGARWRSTVATAQAGPPVPGDRALFLAEPFVRLRLDELDNVNFPRAGQSGYLQWAGSSAALGGDTSYEQVGFNYLQAGTWGRHTVLTAATLHTTLDNDSPLVAEPRLGGFTQLSGFQTGELVGQHLTLVDLIFYRRISDIQWLPAYAGASIELGNTWERRSDIELDDAILAGSLFIGVDTPLGPLYLAGGLADGSHSALYLYLGKLFGQGTEGGL